ncbi:MAG: TlpA family protein disulfide reductase [Chlorobi bacterium]|nr:TlpA family protein disulfide reductase [Chlorobiota bacterium]
MVLPVFIVLLWSATTAVSGRAQDSTAGERLPVVTLKKLDGTPITTQEFVAGSSGPIVLDFWATWCKPCIQELSALSEVYEEWKKLTGVRIIAISIDDARNSKKVAPFVRGRRWQFDVYLDENADLKRALNVNEIPHTFVLDRHGRIVYQHKSYAPGDEELLLDAIRKAAAE